MEYFFSEEQTNYIIQEYLYSKKSVFTIAQEFKCSTSPILRVLKNHNIKIMNKRWHPILTDKQIENLIKDYQQIKNLQIIAKRYDQTVSKVASLLKEHHIEIVNLYTIYKIKEVYWDDIVISYQAGNSLTKIAQIYHVEKNTISRILKRKGIEVVNRQNQARMDEHIFDTINSEEKAYWLGFIYADGYISRGEFGVALARKDENHVLKLQKFLHYTGNLQYKKKTNSCRLSFRNKKIIAALNRLGVVERKSKILIFPNSKQVPKRFLKPFIRGYIDGDGSIGFNKMGLGRLSIIGTESMLNGIIAYMKFKQNKIKKANKNGCDEVKEVSWLGDYVYSYLFRLYHGATIYLDRKYKKVFEIKKNRRAYLKMLKKYRNASLKYKKSVYQKDDEGHIIKKWKTLEEAAHFYKTRPAYIMRVCNHVRKHTCGYVWEYTNQEK